MTKKFSLSIFIMAALFLMSQTVFAAVAEEFMTDSGLGNVKRLAIAPPNHNKDISTPKEPNTDELIEILDLERQLKNFTVISYYDLISAIKNDTGVDITTADFREAEKVLRENIGKYADAYLILTVANANRPATFFFEVRNANNSDIMYNLINRAGKETAGYKTACDEFFKRFDAAVEREMKNVLR